MKTKYEIFLQWKTKFFSSESSMLPTFWILQKLYELCQSCCRNLPESLEWKSFEQSFSWISATRFTELIEFSKIQNVGGLELSEEKILVFHWRKISYFFFTHTHTHTHIYTYIIYIICKRLKKTDDIVNLLSSPKLSIVRSFFAVYRLNQIKK